MTALSITSEVGRLRSVLMHLPGEEIDRMLPSLMGDLLFDDILFGGRAREEHQRLQRVIAKVADEVLLLRPLLGETLSDTQVRATVLADIQEKLQLSPEVMNVLNADSPTQLAGHLIEGILRPGITRMPEHGRDLYLLAPLSNLLFHRDPGIVIGQHVALGSMATKARLREPLLLSYVLTHHPRFAGTSIIFNRFDGDFGKARSTAKPRPSLEGGDLLIVRDDLLLVGSSVRSARASIEDLVAALHQSKSPIRHVLVVELPHARSYMHLDTVFTLISENECLIYDPIVMDNGAEQAAVYQLNLTGREISYCAKPSLLGALEEVGLPLTPITCGGINDPIAQQREQWTDGANAFALMPGVILLYARNERTAEALNRAGYRILTEDAVLSGKEHIPRQPGQRCVVLVEGQELSRARGGPRCLTMPLVRD